MKGLKRIHLFEFEDFDWFPASLRTCMTNYILVMHRILGTEKEIAKLLKPVLDQSSTSKIVDLCSGSGGPMPNVKKILEEDFNSKEIELHLTDLYPNNDAVARFNTEPGIEYHTESVDASNVNSENDGIRTMICSLHHIRPATVKSILLDAQNSGQPFLAFEMSDNSYPKAIWWLTIPINFIMVLLLTPLVRPMTWQQLVFTYLIPLLPLFIAWDGAVSNTRTYTTDDLDLILSELPESPYDWHKDVIKGRAKMLYLQGLSKS